MKESSSSTWLAGRASWVASVTVRLPLLCHQGDVLVTATAEIEQDEIPRPPALLRVPGPCQRVRALEGWDDAFEAGQGGERLQGLTVGHRLIQYPTGVLQESVFRPYPGVVESGGDRMS